MIDLKSIPIFCINLDKRPERAAAFQSQEGLKELNIKRFSAVDGLTLEISKNSLISNQTKYNILNNTRRSHGEINTPGAIGCSLSHFNVWKKFLETKAPYCLVLEDDAMIPKGFAEIIANASKALKELKRFDVWLLSYRLYEPQTIPLTQTWKSPIYFWGTSSYIISRRGVEALSEGFFPIECHLDKYMSLKNGLGHATVVIHKDIKMRNIYYGSDIQLHPCSLCNLPDDIGDQMILSKSLCAVVTGVILMILFVSTKNGL